MKPEYANMTPDEQNDAIRAQVEREIPTPAGGFEDEEDQMAHERRQAERFSELVANPDLWQFVA